MKIVLAQLFILTSAYFAYSGPTNATPPMRLNSHIELPDKSASGFLKFTGQCRTNTFYALSVNVGSAIPSEDFRLYLQTGGGYRLVFSVPLIPRRGFRCERESDTLSVYVVESFKDLDQPGTGQLLLALNLAAFLDAVSDPVRRHTSAVDQKRIK
jgi:hypothetical protein